MVEHNVLFICLYDTEIGMETFVKLTLRLLCSCRAHPSRSADGSSTPLGADGVAGAAVAGGGSGLSAALGDARHAGVGNPAGGNGDSRGDADGLF